MRLQSCYTRWLACAGVISLATVIALADNTEPDRTPVGSNAGIDSAYRQIAVEFESVKPIFKTGCFDCHSDQTDFPWYHSLPIIKGWLDDHVAEAREEIDFSQGFPFPGRRRQADNLFKIKREVEEGAMPLRSYRLMHWGAAPNGEEKDSIYAWVDRSLILLAAHGQYPFNKPENVPIGK